MGKYYGLIILTSASKVSYDLLLNQLMMAVESPWMCRVGRTMDLSQERRVHKASKFKYGVCTQTNTQFEAKIVVLGDQKMNTYTSNLIGWSPIKEDVGTIIKIVYSVKLGGWLEWNNEYGPPPKVRFNGRAVNTPSSSSSRRETGTLLLDPAV